MSPTYRSMIYVAVATLYFYRKDIVVIRGRYTVASFQQRNGPVIERVVQEVANLFDYELSVEQIHRAIAAYLCPPQSVHDGAAAVLPEEV